MKSRMISRFAAITGVLFTVIAMAAAPAAARQGGGPNADRTALQAGTCDGGEGVYLYESPNYQGRCVKLTADVPDLSDPAFNNIASSIRFVGSWTATLFVDQSYSGESTTFTSDDADLGNNTISNDRASSARVQRGAVPAANICDGGEGVYLYENPNYQGRCVKLTADAPDLSEQAFSNLVSSIRLVGGWGATLFVDQNYGGASTVFTANDPDLSDNTIGDNRASAVRVRRTDEVPAGFGCDGSEGVYLYENPNYQGRCARFTADAPDLRAQAFNDTASSIRLLGSWTVTLYRDLSGTGTASTFAQDDANLADNPIGDNQTTSLLILRSVAQPPGESCDGGEGVYLYEHPNYQGRCVKFTADAPDLRVQGFDDTASSFRLIGSWNVTLYRDLNGTGIASTFTQDDSNLADDTIGDNQATSLQVKRDSVPVGDECDGGEGVYVYEHPNYQGRCVKFTADVPDLRVQGFDDTASSVRLIGNWTVTLYRDLNGLGIASTFTQDDANLGDDPLGDNQATSVRVAQR